MKRILITLTALFFTAFILSGQDSRDMVSKCALGIGENTTYLKDFVIKLMAASSGSETPVYKANIYLMKNQTYLFTMCNGDGSEGELVLQLYDKEKQIISSYNRNTDMVYSALEFVCNKTGLYTLWYSFNDGKRGNGVGIVSLLK
ncbi:MAG TPA: hypothetical protein VMW76_02975 [Bacteroidales bacterium]|nr:hypothetical protein [Bacteroidales bacterium]